MRSSRKMIWSAFAALVLGFSVHAATINPITVTGWDADVIFENSSPTFAGTALDGAGHCFFEAGLQLHNDGLPSGGLFTSTSNVNAVFQLQPYVGNNCIVLNAANPTKTLTLATPATYSIISMVAMSGDGGGTGTVTITFTDDTTQVATYNAQDWFNTGATRCFPPSQMGWSGNATNFVYNTTNPPGPGFHETDITISAINASKLIKSLTFQKPASGSNTGIFAVSAGSAAVTPIAINPANWNADVVFENAAGYSAPQSFDTGTACWFEAGATNNGGTPAVRNDGLPAGGLFTSAFNSQVQFQLRPYNGTNCLLMPDTATYTLNLATPASYSLVSILACTGSGGGVGTVTFNFSDASTFTTSFNAQDWGGTGNAAISARGRSTTNNATFTYQAGNFKLFETDIGLGAHSSKTLVSISFSKTFGGKTGIFAVSGKSPNFAFLPVAGSGWNRDVVFENAAGFQGFSFDNANPNTSFTWFEAGATNNGGTPVVPHPDGLPVNGTITGGFNPNALFQMQPYTQNNCLLAIDANPVTFTLNTPNVYQTLCFLSCSGGGSANMTAVIRFTDNTTQTVTINGNDWFGANALNKIVQTRGRSSTTGSTFTYNAPGATGAGLFETDINIAAANSNKLISSIAFTKGTPATTGVFAISGLPKPAILSVTPAAVGLNVSTTITLNGVNFDPAAVVKFNGATVASPTITPTTISFSIPASPSIQTVPITVTNPNGTFATGTFIYTDGVLWTGPNTGGTWNSTANWTPAQIPDISLKVVFPAALTGTVTLDGNQGALAIQSLGGSVTLDSGTPGTSILTLGANGIDTAGNITINAPLAGTSGLNKIGAGTLALTNTGNTLTGGITVTAGTLDLMVGTGVNAAGSNTLNMNGGTLALRGVPVPGGLKSEFFSTRGVAANFASTLSAANAFIASNCDLQSLGAPNLGQTSIITTPNFPNPANSNPPFASVGCPLADFVLARWTGYIQLPAGTSPFHCWSDDGSLVFLDNVDAAFINNNGAHGANSVSATTSNFLTAGLHPITIVYYEIGGGAQVEFGPGTFSGVNIPAPGSPASAASLFSDPTGLTFANNIVLNSTTTISGVQVAGITLSGALSGGGAVTFANANYALTNNTNSFTNTATINTGKLTVGANNALGTVAGGAIVGTGATLEITPGVTTPDPVQLSGILTNVSGTSGVSGNLSLAANATLNSVSGAFNIGSIDLATRTLTFTGVGGATSVGGVISNGNVTINTAGTVQFSGANTYAGTTAVNNGTLTLSGGNAIADTNTVSVATPATLIVGASETLAAITGFGKVNISAGQLTLNSPSNSTLDAVVSGPGSLVKDGASQLSIAGANTYGGGTTVNAGSLRIVGTSSLGNNALALNGANVSIDLQGSGGLTGQYYNLAPSNNTVDNLANLTNALTGQTPAVTAISNIDFRNLNNSYGGEAPFTSVGFNATDNMVVRWTGQIYLPAGVSTMFITSDDGSAVWIEDLAGNLPNAPTVANGGPHGIVTAQGNTPSYPSAGLRNIVVAFFEIGGGAGVYFEYTPNGGVRQAVPASVLVPTAPAAPNTLTLANAINVNTAASITQIGGTNAVLTGQVSIPSGVTLSNGVAPVLTLTGKVTGVGSLTKSGTGTVVLNSATNDYAGGTNINAGTLTASGGGAIVDSGAVSILAGATLNLAADETIGSLGGAGDTNLNAQGLTTGSAGSTTYGGAISGSGQLTKVGATTFVLSGVNTYTGITTINGGTLQVDGSIGNSVMTTVNSGATLSGTGFVGAATVASNGTVAPGDVGTGTLTTGDIDFQSGSNFNVEILGPVTSDSLNVNGSVTISGGSQLNISGGFAPANDTAGFTIISNDAVDAVNGLFNALSTGSVISLNAPNNAHIYSSGTDAGIDGNDVVLLPNRQPISVTMNGPYTFTEGPAHNLTATLVDPDGDPVVYSWTYAAQPGSTGSGSYTGNESGVNQSDLFAFPELDGPNAYDLNLSVVDQLNGTDGVTVNAAPTTVQINNVAPAFTLGDLSFSPLNINESETVAFSGTFTDPGTLDTHSVLVDWGDGSLPDVISLTAADLAIPVMTHTYVDNDNGTSSSDRTITILVTDKDGAFNTPDVSTTVTVNNVSPVIALSGTFTNNSLNPYTLTLGAITDPGPDTVAQYTIHWGDGAVETVGDGINPVVPALNPYTLTHNYAFGVVSPTIVVDLLDEDGLHLAAGVIQPPGFPSDLIEITADLGDALSYELVANGGLTGSPAPVISVANVDLPAGVSSIEDIGLSISGTTISSPALLKSGMVTLALLASNSAGSKIVNVVITIKRSSGGSNTPRVTSIATVTPNPAQVGQLVSFTVSAEDADGDVLSYSWDFGDGTNYGNENRRQNTTHVYAAPGKYIVSMVVSDGKHTTFNHVNMTVIGQNENTYDVSSFKLTLDFRNPTKSSMIVIGKVPVPSSLVIPGSTVNASITGTTYNQDFQMNSKNIGGDQFSQLTLKVSVPGPTSSIAKFTMHLKGVDASGVKLNDRLLPLGYLNKTIGRPGATVVVPLQLTIPAVTGAPQINNIQTNYTAVGNRAGKAKLIKQ